MTTSSLFKLSGYVKAPLANGLGRYITQLQRVTIKFCKSHGCSRGVREFIENDLIDFAKEHPDVVVYLKPRRHRNPVIVAEYINGERKWMPIKQYSRDEVNKWLTLLTRQSGFPVMKLKQYTHTDSPSIQGIWTPDMFKDPVLNVTKFPSKEFEQPANLPPSATELILDLYKRQKEKEGQPMEDHSNIPCQPMNK